MNQPHHPPPRPDPGDAGIDFEQVKEEGEERFGRIYSPARGELQALCPITHDEWARALGPKARSWGYVTAVISGRRNDSRGADGPSVAPRLQRLTHLAGRLGIQVAADALCLDEWSIRNDMDQADKDDVCEQLEFYIDDREAEKAEPPQYEIGKSFISMIRAGLQNKGAANRSPRAVEFGAALHRTEEDGA